MREATKQGRPREFDEEKALLDVLGLFWDLGYEGVSYGDITAATGLRKGSLYAAFGDKAALYRRALGQYEATFVAPLVDALGDRAVPPLARLTNFLKKPMEGSGTGTPAIGCFLCNASTDRVAHDPGSAVVARRAIRQIENGLGIAVSDLMPEATNKEVSEQAALLMSTYMGLQVMARAGQAKTQMETAVSAALRHLCQDTAC